MIKYFLVLSLFVGSLFGQECIGTSCLLPATRMVEYHSTFELNGKKYPIEKLPRSTFVKVRVVTQKDRSNYKSQ